MYIHGRCHMSAGMEVEYIDGVLNVRCVECKKPTASIHVATREQPAAEKQ